MLSVLFPRALLFKCMNRLVFFEVLLGMNPSVEFILIRFSPLLLLVRFRNCVCFRGNDFVNLPHDFCEPFIFNDHIVRFPLGHLFEVLLWGLWGCASLGS